MDRQEFITSSLAEFEARWTAGEFLALPDAVEFCHVAEAPLPEWLALALRSELRAAFHGFTPGQRGLSETPHTTAARRRRDEVREAWVRFFLDEVPTVVDEPGAEPRRMNDEEEARYRRALRGSARRGPPLTETEALRLASEEIGRAEGRILNLGALQAWWKRRQAENGSQQEG